MDLTPQLFRDVQFTERRGAYDREEVDAFLSRVGTAVGQLQERVREAHRRVEAAEERTARLEAKSREHDDANETMQRMIETAARFADEAMKEAKDDAETVIAAARTKADEMLAQAEEAIRRDVGATRDRLEAEIRQLEAHRDALTERVRIIDEHLGAERARLRGHLEELLAVIDDPERLVPTPVPGTDPEPVIVLTDPAPSDPDLDAGGPPTEAVAPVTGTPATGIADDDLADLPPPPEDWDPSAIAAPAADDPDGGPPTEAHAIVSPGTAFGGNHLEELRRAVSEENADAEADAAMAAFFDQDSDDEPSRRFGRRR